MANGVNGNVIGARRARAFFGSSILLLILAIMFAPAFAAAPTARAAPKGGPHLANLQIEIWPEFDRPAAALVFVKGEIASDVRLPVALTLRIAARSGGPTAVAYSAESGGELFNLEYEREDADDFITLKFNVPGRFFHIEYYDPLAARTPGRSYTYLWAGDLGTDRLRLVLQEPAAVSELSVQPTLADTAVDPDGLRYRSAELGAFKVGKQLDVQVNYTKSDPRTTIAILRPEAADTSPQTIATPSKKELGLWLVTIVVVLVAGGIGASAWWYRRKPEPEAPSSGATFCTKCGSPLAPGDRFCSQCGVALT